MQREKETRDFLVHVPERQEGRKEGEKQRDVADVTKQGTAEKSEGKVE